MGTETQLRSNILNEFENSYKSRRRSQMLRFCTCSLITVLVCRKALKYTGRGNPAGTFPIWFTRPKEQKPNLLMLAGAVNIGGISMLYTGACWTWNVSNWVELQQRAAAKRENEPWGMLGYNTCVMVSECIIEGNK